MKNMILTAAFIAAAAFGQTKYDIDSAHSSAQFSVKHLMVSNVRGEFSKVAGTVYFDARNINASKVDATIDANSISTREPKRDEHLKSADFFDTAKFPTLTFKSKSVWKQGNQVMVKGDLTIHGITKEAVLTLDTVPQEVKDPWGMQRIGTQATTKINRKDYGLVYNQTLDNGGVMISDEVSITLDIEAVKAKATPATN